MSQNQPDDLRVKQDHILAIVRSLRELGITEKALEPIIRYAIIDMWADASPRHGNTT